MTESQSDLTHIDTLGSSCQYSWDKRWGYIARGSFGVVYKARITESSIFPADQIVAVKCVHLHNNEAALLANSESWRMIRLRWEMTFSLKHSHLLAYYKASVIKAVTGGVTVEFVMDYYEEGDLAAFLSANKLREKQQPFEQEEVICFAMQLAKGLSFLHQHCVIHGDLKPGNILVASVDKKHRKLIIGDLDDAVQMRQKDTIPADILHARGTLRYMSPEMVRMWLTQASNQNIGRKTDIWSLGCIILDLANHSVGNKERYLYKGDEIRVAVEVLLPGQDYQFAVLMNGGWIPFVPKSVPGPVAACIRKCLRSDSTCRILADKLMEKLRHAATELHRSSNANHPVDQECFCFFPSWP